MQQKPLRIAAPLLSLFVIPAAYHILGRRQWIG